MGKVAVTEQSLTDIADAIRGKLDVETTYRPSQMAAAIGSIPSVTAADNGKVVVNEALVSQTARNISDNGTYDTTTNNEVTVAVSHSYAAADEGKVVSSGALVAQTSRTVYADGTYDTTLNDEVIVNSGGTNNDLLFHFDDFKNYGKLDAAFYNTTGYVISNEQSKFGPTSLKVNSSPSTNGAVYLPNGFSIGTDDFTIDFWMYQTSSSTGSCAISFNYRSLGYYSNNGFIRDLAVATSSSSWTVDRSITYETSVVNGWHHVAITRESGTVRVFVDGVKEDEFSFASSFPTMTRLSFGTNSKDGTSWRGYIDEFRMKLGEAVWTDDFTPPTQEYS